ncbi:MAG: ABC transporter permease [Gemmatimonadota bacterium]|jgi:ABC-type transport system involved in multi-copper enzyme maturation permease subunit|nr:ABC transporter permease [Gemmatimonadota bacterium]MDP6803032.1 ABC transporter permease [Gemmatimonadota bacterium]MDP7032123.1 ABC transporter permease [Gemmatimonadota bacterium]
MRDITVIFRREFGAYFNSPIASIFIIVFLFLTSGFYANGFFLAGVVDMRDFFSSLPLFLIFFIPALTMRLWAEEQRLGTFELLMTLPMKPFHIVLGKYLAALLFYAIALGCTLTIPLTLAWIGSPDPGAIFCGYLGAFLLGGLYLSIGIFVSGLFKDQIAAFVLTLLACFFFFLSGTPFVAALLDGWIPGAGSFLQEAFGLARHFDGIQRGVIGVDNIVFFVSFSAAFLLLNTHSLEGRKY